MPSSAAEAAPDCWAVASTPRYVEGSIVYAGEVRCRTVVPETYVYVRLELSDGSFEAETQKDCEKTSFCRDVGYHPNRSGNQVWCTEVYGPYIDSARACESQNW